MFGLGGLFGGSSGGGGAAGALPGSSNTATSGPINAGGLSDSASFNTGGGGSSPWIWGAVAGFVIALVLVLRRP